MSGCENIFGKELKKIGFRKGRRFEGCCLIYMSNSSLWYVYHFILIYPIDISIYQSGYPTTQFHESINQCLANNTVVSASIIDNSASKGITCCRKDSTATGTWTHNGVEVECSDTTGPVKCTIHQSGSVTLYTAGPYNNGGDDVAVPEGIYTCCIDGLCISIRLWQFATVSSMFPYTVSDTNIV